MDISASTCLTITYVCIMKNYPQLINMGTYIPSHCIALHRIALHPILSPLGPENITRVQGRVRLLNPERLPRVLVIKLLA